MRHASFKVLGYEGPSNFFCLVRSCPGSKTCQQQANKWMLQQQLLENCGLGSDICLRLRWVSLSGHWKHLWSFSWTPTIGIRRTAHHSEKVTGAIYKWKSQHCALDRVQSFQGSLSTDCLLDEHQDSQEHSLKITGLKSRGSLWAHPPPLEYSTKLRSHAASKSSGKKPFIGCTWLLLTLQSKGDHQARYN